MLRPAPIIWSQIFKSPIGLAAIAASMGWLDIVFGMGALRLTRARIERHNMVKGQVFRQDVLFTDIASQAITLKNTGIAYLAYTCGFLLRSIYSMLCKQLQFMLGIVFRPIKLLSPLFVLCKAFLAVCLMICFAPLILTFLTVRMQAIFLGTVFAKFTKWLFSLTGIAPLGSTDTSSIPCVIPHGFPSASSFSRYNRLIARLAVCPIATFVICCPVKLIDWLFDFAFYTDLRQWNLDKFFPTLICTFLTGGLTACRVIAVFVELFNRLFSTALRTNFSGEKRGWGKDTSMLLHAFLAVWPISRFLTNVLGKGFDRLFLLAMGANFRQGKQGQLNRVIQFTHSYASPNQAYGLEVMGARNACGLVLLPSIITHPEWRVQPSLMQLS